VANVPFSVDIPMAVSKLRLMKTLIFLIAAILMQGVVHAANQSVQEIKLNTIDGKPTSLGEYKGKVVLLVNVASQCGLTPQYKELQALQERYKDKGFTVIGVPCNDFGSQEPGSSKEIVQFCTEKYNVTFPLMEKVHVKGSEQHPLYARLTGKEAEFPGDIKWNFGKFLIGKDGKVLKRFEPQTKPDAEEVVKAIEGALAAK
jgi:glutathione peroxidase